MTVTQARHLMALWRVRGADLASQGISLDAMLGSAPVDMVDVLGPVLLLAQGYAKAQTNALAWLRADPAVVTWPLDEQGEIARLADLWTQLHSGLGALAFAKRLPRFAALMPNMPGAARYQGVNAIGVGVAVQLEQVLNVSGAAGITLTSFWTLTAQARNELGRLIALDPILQETVDIDVPAAVDAALTEGLPLAPDPTRMLEKIESAKAPRYHESPVARAQLATVLDGLTLQAMAQLHLGDVNQWRELASFNNLRYPYISANPIDQFGDPVGIAALTDAVPAGAITLTLLDAHALYLDQRLYCDPGVDPAMLTLTAVDRETGQVAFTPPLAASLPVTTVITVYPPVYDIVGRVLVPGQQMLIPLVTATTGALGLGAIGREVRVADRVYGTDVELTPVGQLRFVEGDLARIAGIPNLCQALRNLFKVPRGSYLHHPRYGTGFEAMLSVRISAFTEFLSIVEARQALLRDPRVARVEHVSVEQRQDTLVVNAIAVTTNDEQFAPTGLTAALRA